MATTSPDNLRTPDPGDPYNLVADLATLANDVQTALDTKEVNVFRGTASQRVTFTPNALEGMLWVDTDGIKMIWRKGITDWEPAVWDWSGTTAQMNAFPAPDGFKWLSTDDKREYVFSSGNWLPAHPLCILQKSTSQNLTTAGAPISWDVEVFDDENMHDNAVNNSRIAAPIDGVYKVTFVGYNSNASGTGTIYGRLNGSIDITGSQFRGGGASGVGVPLITSFPVTMDAGDYVEIIAQHTTATGSLSGGTTSNSAVITVELLRRR